MILNPEVNKKSQIYWDIWWLQMAKQYSSGSKDPSTKVGAVIVHKKRLKSAGYNGFAPDTDDNPDLYWDRDYKMEHCTHAEVNALKSLDQSISDATMYTYPFMPCVSCAKLIANDLRIERIVTTDYVPERWLESFVEAKKVIENSRIQLVQYPFTQVIQ